MSLSFYTIILSKDRAPVTVQVTRDRNHRCSQFWKCQKYSRRTVDWLPALISHVMIFRWPSCPIFQHADIFSIYRIALLYVTPFPSTHFRPSSPRLRISLDLSISQKKRPLLVLPCTVTLIFTPSSPNNPLDAFSTRYQINNYFNKAVKFTHTRIYTHVRSVIFASSEIQERRM